MNFEKLYTKYKFNAQELFILTKINKTDTKGLEDKLDQMSYDERKALFFIMNTFMMGAESVN